MVSRPEIETSSSPVRPSDLRVSPPVNSNGMTPMPTRFERWMRSKFLGDHGLDTQKRRALGGPVAGRSGAVLFAAKDHQRRARGLIGHGRVVDRGLRAVRALGVAALDSPSSLASISFLMRILAKVPRIITSWLPRREP